MVKEYNIFLIRKFACVRGYRNHYLIKIHQRLTAEPIQVQ